MKRGLFPQIRRPVRRLGHRRAGDQCRARVCGSSTRRTAALRSRSSTRKPRRPLRRSNRSCARSSGRSAGWRRRNGRRCRSSSGASTMPPARQVPAITELVQLDRQGREQLKVSRITMDVVGGGTDLSKEPAFVEAMAHRVWFGPVYFRKESEPYMTMAVAHGGARRRHRGRDQPQADLGTSSRRSRSARTATPTSSTARAGWWRIPTSRWCCAAPT